MDVAEGDEDLKDKDGKATWLDTLAEEGDEEDVVAAMIAAEEKMTVMTSRIWNRWRPVACLVGKERS